MHPSYCDWKRDKRIAILSNGNLSECPCYCSTQHQGSEISNTSILNDSAMLIASLVVSTKQLTLTDKRHHWQDNWLDVITCDVSSQ